MTHSARAARNLLLCTLVTIPLAACGGGSSGSSTATATSADTAAAPAEQNVGVIDRSPGASSTAAVAPSTAAVAPSTATTTPTSDGTIAKTPTPPVTSINGVATLDWQPPTANTDGTALTNLAGYTVYYGTSPDNLSQSVKVTNPGLTAYSVTGLTSGTWYFAVTSVTTDGVESARTSTVSTKI
jgi:hypothetical protein